MSRRFVKEEQARGGQLRRRVHEGGARPHPRAARRRQSHQPGTCRPHCTLCTIQVYIVYSMQVADGALCRVSQEEFRGFSFVNKDFNPAPAADKPAQA